MGGLQPNWNWITIAVDNGHTKYRSKSTLMYIYHPTFHTISRYSKCFIFLK